MKKPNEQYYKTPRMLGRVLRLLSTNQFRSFLCIMEEHQSKSGFVNDGLPVTRRDLIAFGVHPRHITSSINILCELGIIEKTHSLGPSRRGRQPNLYRPTFVPRTPSSDDATHDYLKFSEEQMREIIDANTIRDKRDRPINSPSRTKAPKIKLPTLNTLNVVQSKGKAK
jgi:hypothetical protein